VAKHVIQQGECIATLASRAGVAVEDIWHHSDNRELRERRRSPYVLAPGDVVCVPAPEPQQFDGATGKTHRFRGNTTKLRLTLTHDGSALADEPYDLQIAGSSYPGRTSGQGKIDVTIPVSAMEGALWFPERRWRIDLGIGQLDPVDTPTGAQARLSQLGYYPGRVDADFGPVSQAALRDFQKDHGMEQTGRLDRPSIDKLLEIYGV
jgi:hypothetical protein